MRGERLTAHGVEVAYGSTRVLNGLSLAVEPGEFIALLGSSGCGKTTLLRAISGFVKVASGRIRVSDRDITDLPPDRRGMAMVFQSYALWPHMTAAENIAYGLRIRGVPRTERRRRVAAMLELLNLDGLGERRVDQLSGGQRQRVALGRALAIDPGMLLLDEPLSNLDARIRQAVRHEIKALQTRLGITALHVTHDREEAMVMADRIAIMDAGRLVQIGTPEEVYERPNSPFVADFMGADNVIGLTIARRGDTVRVAPSDDSDAAVLPISAALGAPGVHVSGDAEDQVDGHFRSEAAALLAAGETAPSSLMLRGRVVQTSYPGGFHRYAVEVGQRRYLVDDGRRFAVGDPVAVAIPANALHLYARAAA